LVAGDDNEVFDVFVHDLLTRTTVRVSVAASGQASQDGATHPAISADGRYVAFERAVAPLVRGAMTVHLSNEYQIYVHERPRRVS
jgi:Tol biopolymer transport system component